MISKQVLSGSCMCGSIEYSASSQPKMSFLCQCRQCQKITGTGHSAEFAITEQDVSITGNLKSFELQSDAGNTVTSVFCPTCGNPIYKKSAGYPGLLFIHAATLDKPELFTPQSLFWHSSAQDWDLVDTKLELKLK